MRPQIEIEKLRAQLLKEAEDARKREGVIKAQAAELKAIHKENDSIVAIREQLGYLRGLEDTPPEWAIKPAPAHLPGVPMTIWSDFHWGERVFASQVNHVNKFNRAIAQERLKNLVQITIDLCFSHMIHPKYPGIVLCLGGDIISGSIHEELRETNEGTVQETLKEVRGCLKTAITAIADKFGKVFIPCVVGNHGRTTLKPRAKNRTFESFEWGLYHQLAEHFENDKRIKFYIPDDIDAYFTVQGHRFLLTHGDALGVKGGDGIIGAIGPIARGNVKVGRAERQIGRDYDTLIIGHWHSYSPRGDLLPVVVNGALKGYDEYAKNMLRVPYSRPSQALWFIHEKHGFTAQWPIYLDGKRKSSDKTKWISWES